MSAEADIRAVVDGWVAAIRACDLDGVTAAHSENIVMFDVQSPYEGIRGAAAYRQSWPPFFDFIRSGATFELLELHVEADRDVAFAFGLLRCGTEKEFAQNPDNRLRLTMGLRKSAAGWQIVHEHHSFPDDT
ncbi:nuclear transport factor 2 family protein [Mycobacterium sp. NPDC003323]